MSKKEINISEFEILQRHTSGAKHLGKFIGKPLVFLNNSVGSMNDDASKKLGAKNSDAVVFAKRNDIMYVAVLPFDSKIRGFILKDRGSKSGTLFFNISKVYKYDKGIYEILESVYSGGIDWFELELIESIDA